MSLRQEPRVLQAPEATECSSRSFPVSEPFGSFEYPLPGIPGYLQNSKTKVSCSYHPSRYCRVETEEFTSSSLVAAVPPDISIVSDR